MSCCVYLAVGGEIIIHDLLFRGKSCLEAFEVHHSFA